MKILSIKNDALANDSQTIIRATTLSRNVPTGAENGSVYV
jgi:hypothetical protein